MNEAQFQNELKKSFNSRGHFCEKIPDAVRSMGSRFIPTKPADLFGHVEGKAFLIECKQIKKWRTWGMRDMRPSQIKGLTDFADTGGAAYVILNVRITKERENRLILFTWAQLKRFKKFNIDELKDLDYVIGSKKDYPIDYILINRIRDN